METHGIKKSYHGIAYQILWNMVVAVEANDRKNAFTFKTQDFQTEDPEAGDFDDVVWKYGRGGSKKIFYNFLQAKHKIYQNEKISLTDLLKSSARKKKSTLNFRETKDKKPFALHKYFNSYQNLKNCAKYRDGQIISLIIAMNINLDDDLKKNLFVRREEKIPILELVRIATGKKPEVWKINESSLHYSTIVAQLNCNKRSRKVTGGTVYEENINDEISEFFSLLSFVVNYSQGDLDKVVRKKCREFTGFKSDFVAHEFQVMVSNALNLGRENFISGVEEVKSFFKKSEEKMKAIALIGLTLDYRCMVMENEVEFCEEVVKNLLEYRWEGKDLNFLESNVKVFILVTEEVDLTAIKLLQKIEALEEYKQYGSYVSLNLSSALRIQNFLIEAEANLLVIKCDIVTKNNCEIVIEELFSMLSERFQKIIFVTREGNKSVDKFKNEFSEDFKEKYDSTNDFNDLTDKSQKVLLDKEVLFQGKEICLRLLFEDPNSRKLINEYFIARLINNEKVKIGRPLRSLGVIEEYYIQRSFYCWRTINKKKFKEARKSGTIRYITNDQVDRFEPRGSQENIVLMSDMAESFKALCIRYPNCNIYWIKETEGNLLLQRFHGENKLKNMLDEWESAITKYEPNKITDVDDKVVIISGEPGIGKSTVLMKLATATQMDSSKPLWILKINLINHSRKFFNSPEVEDNMELARALKLLYKLVDFQVIKSETGNLAEKSIMDLFELSVDKEGNVGVKNVDREREIKNLLWLEVSLFSEFYNQGRVIILFDGFDEISPDYKGKVIAFFKELKNSNVKNMWITTRPYNILSDLAKSLGAIPYRFCSLKNEECYIFFEKFWKTKQKNLGELNKQRTQIFTHKLLTYFKDSTNDKESKFISLPLHAAMIAEVAWPLFEKFLMNNSSKFSDELEEELKKLLSLSNLYDEFIKVKFYEIRFKEKKSNMNLDDPDIKQLIENERRKVLEEHRKLAVYTLFNDDERKTLLTTGELASIVGNNGLIEQIKNAKDKNGFVDCVIDDKIIFVHQTYAEYFAASCLWEKFWMVAEIDVASFIKSLMLHVFCGQKLQICRFFYSIAEQKFKENIRFDYKIKALLEQTIKEVKSLYDNYRKYSMYSEDGMDRKDDGYEDISQSKKCLLQVIDAFQWNEDALIRNLELSDRWAVLNVASEAGCKNIVNVLVKDKVSQVIFQSILDNKNCKWYHNPLWVAAQKSHLDIIKTLNEHGFSPDWMDKDRRTLLQQIMDCNDFNILRSCLKLKLIDFSRSYTDWNKFDKSVLCKCVANDAPSDIVEALINITDYDYLNQVKEVNYPDGITFVLMQLVRYESTLLLPFLQKMYRYNMDKSVIFLNYFSFEFSHESMVVPNYKEGEEEPSYWLIRQLFDSNDHFLNFPCLVKTLLEAGIVFNFYEKTNNFKPLDILKQTYHVHCLLKKIGGKCINLKTLEEIFRILLKKMIQDSDGIKFAYNCLYTLNRDQYGSIGVKQLFDLKQIPILVQYFQTLNTSDSERMKKELKKFISKKENFQFVLKGDPTSEALEKIEDNLLIEEKSDLELIKGTLQKVVYLKQTQNYSLDNALEEVLAEMDYHLVKGLLLKITKLKEGKSYTVEEAISKLGLDETYDYMEELQEFMAIIGGCEIIMYTAYFMNLLKFSTVGKNNRRAVIETIIKDSESAEAAFELLKLVDEAFHCVERGNEDMLNEKLERSDCLKAICNARNDKFFTLLHFSVETENTSEIRQKIVRALLKKGANVNATTNKGLTPLHMAAEKGFLEIVRMFLEETSIDVFAKTNDNLTALDLAKQSGHLSVIEALQAFSCTQSHGIYPCSSLHT